MFKTKEELYLAINKCLPYSDQIKDLNFTTEKESIYLTWRGNEFKISLDGDVNEVDRSILVGTDLSIMFRQLIRMQHISEL